MSRHLTVLRSAYYPPRARWYSPVLRPAQWLRRVLHLEQIHLPPPRTVLQGLLGLLVPGLSFYLAGQRLAARCIFAGCAVAMLIFLIFLGHPAADWAFLALISAHVASVTQQILPWITSRRVWAQLVLSVILFAGINQFVYVPARNWFLRHVAMPLQTPRGVVIVNPSARRGRIQQADWVAYRIEANVAGLIGANHGSIVLRAGYGYGPVLALPGDRVEFGPEVCQINGAPIPRLTDMPASGTLTVPENHWFVWPELRISGHGNFTASLEAEMERLALVDQNDFVGRPFKRWFFTKQVTP